MPQLLASKGMDAFILWEPSPTRAVQQGAKVLMPIREFKLSYVLTVATRPDWLQAHPQQAKALMQALAEATTFVKEHPPMRRRSPKSCSNPRAVDGTRDQATPVRDA